MSILEPIAKRSEYYGALQDVVDALFAQTAMTPLSPRPSAPRFAGLDGWWLPRRQDLPDELLRIVTLLPPGDYTRQRLHPAEQRHRRIRRLGPGLRYGGRHAGDCCSSCKERG